MTTASARIIRGSDAGVERRVAIDFRKTIAGAQDHAELGEMVDHVLMAGRILGVVVDDDAAVPRRAGRTRAGPAGDVGPLRRPPDGRALGEVGLPRTGHARR